MSEFLLEIGCEEIPARMLPDAISVLRQRLLQALAAATLACERVETHGTPRRLMAEVVGLAEFQPDREELRRGPAWNSAFDPSGQPTRTALGFAASCGVAVSELVPLSTPKGAYVSCRLRHAGGPASHILGQILADLIPNFPWPKVMRWGSGDLRFVRPIHSVTALLDGQMVPFSFPNDRDPPQETPLVVGNQVAGHRFMAPGPYLVRGIADYRTRMRDAKVVVDFSERRQIIRQGVIRVSAEAGGIAALDEGLLDETACLVEWPVVLAGCFDPVYLAIPPEVLVTSMKVHQKYFPVRHQDGSLLPRFAVVANIEVPDPEVLIRGYQRVLRARLEDAAFYWGEDRKIALADRLEGLKSVVYQARLGSLYQKSLRVQSLAGEVAAMIAPHVRKEAERAAELCKCDLITGMVAEFPELQGVMGGYYAAHSGEGATVAAAIREHYQPQGASDTLPVSVVGLCLAIADKLDTLTGCFAIGLEPSGTKDPFALRRAALGVIRMLLDGNFSGAVPLRPLLERAYAAYRSDQLDLSASATGAKLIDFFYGRLSAHLKADGLEYDLIEAVRALHSDNLVDAVARVRALDQFKRIPGYASLVAANKRIANILDKGAGKGAEEDESGPVQPDLLQADQERHLFVELERCSGQVAELAGKGEYSQALALLADLRQPIDQFFDHVLVNDPDAGLRTNRRRLLAQVRGVFGQIADISRLVLAEG